MIKQLSLIACSFLLAFSANAQLELPSVFTDHLVLQQDKDLLFWGKSAPKTRVSIVIGKNSRTVKSDSEGNWELKLNKMDAGGPYEVFFDTKTERRVLRDVYIGEVYYFMGQSNMEMALANCEGGLEAAANSDPMLRFYKVPRQSALLPQSSLSKAVNWQTATDLTQNEQFSGLAFFFAQKIRLLKPEVAVGIVQVTWSGSKIESWLSHSANGFSTTADLEKMITTEVKNQLATDQKNINDFFDTTVTPSTPAAFNRKQQPSVTARIKDLPKGELTINGSWEQHPKLKGLNGVVWLRKTVELTPQQAQNSAELNLGMVDDDDYTFVNGRLVGSVIEGYDVPRSYLISSGLLQAGTNEILVRVTDVGGAGGLISKPEDLYFQTTTERLPLAGKWELLLDQYWAEDLEVRANQFPSMIHNGMVTPFGKFASRGVVWYQGESNTATTKEAFAYRKKLRALIKQTRQQLEDDALPFFVIQLPLYGAAPDQPGNSKWALLRESQADAAELNQVFLVPTLDLGVADNLHPPYEKAIADRLYQPCRELIYRNKTIPWKSPRAGDIEFKSGGRVIIKVPEGSQGLNVDDRYGYLRGFQIAGPDKKFVWAPARLLNKQTIEVYHPSIKKIAAVRYAWADNPADANVIGGNGLPFIPFRSDDWED